MDVVRWMSLAGDGRVLPLTLHMYGRAAATSSAVAAGCNPRNSVMFRHMISTIGAGRRLSAAVVAQRRALRQVPRPR
jgi:hypothetical protein